MTDYKLYAACRTTGRLMSLTLSGGTLRADSEAAASHPMYLAEGEDELFLLENSPFEGSDESALLRYRKAGDGLVPCGAPLPSGGAEACHLCRFDGHIYYTNYASGSIASDNGAFAQRTGGSIVPERQRSAHPHQIIPTPDGRLAVCDLGCDAVAFYDHRLKLLGETGVAPGSGVRHAVFSSCGRYLYTVGELDSVVRQYAYHGGDSPKLEFIASAPALPEQPGGYAAALRIDDSGGRLFVSIRGPDVLSVLDCSGPISFTGSVSCGGSFPRDLDISPDGEYLVCANELSGSLTVFSLAGRLPRQLSEYNCGGNPMCVLFSRFA